MIEYKVCTKCDTRLPVSAFDKEKRAASGYRSQCKACREISRQIRAGTLPKKIEGEQAAPREWLNRGVYVPEQGLYRNDGHKNLKSKGFLC